WQDVSRVVPLVSGRPAKRGASADGIPATACTRTQRNPEPGEISRRQRQCVAGKEKPMSKKRSTPSVTPEELETLVRRVVREELSRVLQRPVRSILDDWKQEGPEDPEGDALLLREALAVLREY